MKLITIPMVPPSPNELRRKYRHPQAYRRLREQWEHDLMYGVSCSRHRQELIKQAKESNRVHVGVAIFHSKPYDPDNLVGSVKPILDALRNLGYIQDDTLEKLDLAVIQYVCKDARKTLVSIGPV